MIEVTRDGHVATVTLAPGAGVEALAGALEGLDADVRAVVLRERDGAFAQPERLEGPPRVVARARLDAFDRIERLPFPVIVEVTGAAIGWGFEVALAADLVVAAGGAEFGLTRGLADEFPAYGLLRGPDSIGAHWTKYLAFTGRRIDAATAERIGLVYELAADAREIAAAIARNAPLGVAAGKSLAGRGRDDGGREHAAEALAATLAER